MKINMHRGDTSYKRFTICNPNGSVNDTDFDEIYFTVKHSTNCAKYIFQKKLSDGGIIRDGDTYKFVILPEDTNDLDITSSTVKYVFDIEVVREVPLLKQTFLGEMRLMPEVTHAGNEG